MREGVDMTDSERIEVLEQIVRATDADERIRILADITDAQRGTTESLMRRIEALERRINAMEDRTRGLAAWGGGG